MGMPRWAVIAGAVVAGVVLLAGLGLGVSTIAAQGLATTPTPLPEQPDPGERCPCGWNRVGAARFGWWARGQAEIVAQALGMSVEDLTAALREGHSVADLAAEKGVALETIVEALLASRQQALLQAVTGGRLTSEQAERMLEQMRENVQERLQEHERFLGTGPAGQMLRAERLGWRLRGQAEIVAQALGMSVEDLTAALREGHSVADLAAEKGVALETIVEALLASRQQVLLQAVTGGRLTSEQAEQMLQRMRENIIERLRQPGPFRPLPDGGEGSGRAAMGGCGMGRGTSGWGNDRGGAGTGEGPVR